MMRFALCFVAVSAVSPSKKARHAALMATHATPDTATDDQIGEVVSALQQVAVEVREQACADWKEYLTAYNQIVNRLYDLGAVGDKQGTYQMITKLNAAAGTTGSIKTLHDAWAEKRRTQAEKVGEMKRHSTHSKEETTNAARMAQMKMQVEEKFAKKINEHKTLLVAYANAYAAITKSNVDDVFHKYVDETSVAAENELAYLSGTLGQCVDASADDNDECAKQASGDKNECEAAVGCKWDVHFTGSCADKFPNDMSKVCPHEGSLDKSACEGEENCIWSKTVTHFAGAFRYDTHSTNWWRNWDNPTAFIQVDSEKGFGDKVTATLQNIMSAMSMLSPGPKEAHKAHMEQMNKFGLVQAEAQPRHQGQMVGAWNTGKVDNVREEMISNWLLQAVKETDSIIKQLMNELMAKTRALETLEGNAQSDVVQSTNSAVTAMEAAEVASSEAHTANQAYQNSLRLREALTTEQAGLFSELARISTTFFETQKDNYDSLVGIHFAGSTLAGTMTWATWWEGTGATTNSAFMNGDSTTDGLFCGNSPEMNMDAFQLEGIMDQFGNYNAASNALGLYASAGDKFWEKSPAEMLALIEDTADGNLVSQLDGTAWKDNDAYDASNTGFSTDADNSDPRSVTLGAAKLLGFEGFNQAILDASGETGDSMQDETYDSDLSCSSNLVEADCVGVASTSAHYPCVWHQNKCKTWSETLAITICGAKIDSADCGNSADCIWTDMACTDGQGADIGAFDPNAADPESNCVATNGGNFKDSHCAYDTPAFFLQTSEKTNEAPHACVTWTSAEQCHDFTGRDCVWDTQGNAGAGECVEMYPAVQTDPMHVFLKDTNAVSVFTSLIAPVEARKSALQMVLNQLRANEGKCKLRMREHKQNMRSSVLSWNEYFQRFSTARDAWKRAEESRADASARVKMVQDQIANDGVQHSKAQANYQSRMNKWGQGEQALTISIQTLQNTGADNAATIRLIDALRDRIVRQQLQATEDINKEHLEYKRNVRHAMATLNAFETELANALSDSTIANTRMSNAWTKVKFTDTNGEDQEPTIHSFDDFDEWPVNPDDHDNAGVLADAEGDGFVDLVMSGSESETDGDVTKSVFDETKDVLAFDNCETVQIGAVNDLADDTVTDANRNSAGGSVWSDYEDTVGNVAVSGDAALLYAEQNANTWQVARQNIQSQIDRCAGLLGLLARFQGTPATSNIIGPAPYLP